MVHYSLFSVGQKDLNASFSIATASHRFLLSRAASAARDCLPNASALLSDYFHYHVYLTM